MNGYAKTPTIFQMEITECGAASLGMVLAYYGCHVPLEKLRIQMGVSRDGTTMRGIKQAAISYGLKVSVKRFDLEKLEKASVPCIIHWEFNHFVVFEGFKGGYAYINDPAFGRRRLTRKELDEGFTGVTALFEKDKGFRRNRKRQSAFSFCAGRLRGYLPVLGRLVYIGLLLVVPGLALPVFSQVFIDDILGKGYTDWLVRLLVLMGGILLFKEALSYYRDLLLQKLRAKMTLLSVRDFLEHMFRLPAAFFDQRAAGDLVSRVGSNEEVSAFLAGDLAETILNIFTAVFYLIILLLYSPVMTMIGLLQILFSVLAMAMSSQTLKDETIRLQMTQGRVSGAVSAGLGITDSIKASGMEAQYGKRLMGYQAEHAGFEQALTRRQKILSIIPETAGKIVDVLLLLVGGLMVIRGEMTIGMLVAYNALYDSFCAPVNAMVGFFHQLQQLRSNIARVEDIERHGKSPEYTRKAQAEPAQGRLQGSIELRGVSFGYNVIRAPIVHQFDVSIRQGETVAFVGASGCGKSTMAKLISGLYEPWEGEVLYDGIAGKDVPLQTLHGSIATVSQDIHLFSGSIRDNLTMWDDSILDEDIEDALRDACLHDFVMQLPGGYDYRLEEEGRNLSGGQRQRLEIARALAGRPSILVMDEATSALDPIVEKQIMDNVRRRGCTCVLVAHRLSTIRDCSQIIVMQGGRIVQKGTHASLMREEGCYAALIRHQTQGSAPAQGI